MTTLTETTPEGDASCGMASALTASPSRRATIAAPRVADSCSNTAMRAPSMRATRSFSCTLRRTALVCVGPERVELVDLDQQEMHRQLLASAAPVLFVQMSEERSSVREAGLGIDARCGTQLARERAHAQVRSDACAQRRVRDGLGDRVDGASLDRAELEAGLCPRCEDHHRHAREHGIGAHGVEQGCIDHDEIGRRELRLRQRRLRARCHVDVGEVGELRHHRVALDRIFVHDENAMTTIGGATERGGGAIQHHSPSRTIALRA